jgi:GTP-binding protein
VVKASQKSKDPHFVRSEYNKAVIPTTSTLVVIVGRPNVGKSTLFNKLTRQRRSIVGDEPGITRDRIYGEAEWGGRTFALVDTGGMVPDDDGVIPVNILKQAELAIEDAHVLIWVVDVRQGITPLDEELAELLRATEKPVFVAANKADSVMLDADAGEFYGFGFKAVFPISAEHGTGIADLLDSLLQDFPAPTDGEGGTVLEERTAKSEIGVAIVGRPNVGKSSLLNRLLGQDRVIVSSLPGTTRDSVDTVLKTESGTFRLIDTAGIRRKGKTDETTEKLAVLMARRSLERADIAIVVIDGEEGVTALDANIAGYAVDAGCSIILAVNKWDAVKNKETGSVAAFERTVRKRMKFLDWAPIVTISALTGQRTDNILPIALRTAEARWRRIPTSRLNEFFEINVSQPRGGGAPAPVKGGRSYLHVQYLTQIGVGPPKFVLFTAGGRSGLHFSYPRYLENRLRESFDFFGTPIQFIERHKKKKRFESR